MHCYLLLCICYGVAAAGYLSQFELPEYDTAISIEDVRPLEAVGLFRTILHMVDKELKLLRVKEESILHLGKIYAKLDRHDDLRKLFVEIRPFFSVIPKSRTAKIGKRVLLLVLFSVLRTTASLRRAKRLLSLRFRCCTSGCGIRSALP